VFLASLLCGSAFTRRRTWKRLAIASVYAFVVFTAVAMTSCSGPSGSQQVSSEATTPPGTYTLTVTGTYTPTGASTSVTRTLQLTLAVQQPPS